MAPPFRARSACMAGASGTGPAWRRWERSSWPKPGRITPRSFVIFIPGSSSSAGTERISDRGPMRPQDQKQPRIYDQVRTEETALNFLLGPHLIADPQL